MNNYNLKFTFRTLWKNRFFTLLNILGLSIGLAAAWVVYQISDYEYSFDVQHPNRAKVYRVVSDYVTDKEESGNGGAPSPIARAASGVAGVEVATPVFSKYYSNVIVPGYGGSNQRVFEEDIYQIIETDSRYFRITPYHWLAGNSLNALDAPGQVVLTRSRAARYYPGLSPDQILGQTVIYQDTGRCLVTGVVEDLAYPSIFEAKEMRSLSKPIPEDKRSWLGVSSNQQSFVMLDPQADPVKVAQQISAISDENSKEALAKYSTRRTQRLQPLADVHFNSKYSSHIRTANPKVLYGMMGVAGFLLLLAIINYINLATAQLPQRTREIGVRKTLGGMNRGIIGQFLMETAVTTTFSLLVAAVLAVAFLREFQEMIPSDKELLDFVQYGSLTGFALLLIGGVSLLSGLYPGWLMGRFQPVSLLKGQVSDTNKTGVRFRQGLIVFQFVVSQLLLVAALVVGQQMRFLMQQDLGFDREAIVMIDIPWKVMEKPGMKDKHFILADELKKLPEVAGLSVGEQLFSYSYSSNRLKTENEKGAFTEHDVNFRAVDTAALSLYNMKLITGRNLVPSDTAREYIINETAVEAFGFASPEAAVGRFLKDGDGRMFPIVGVVQDFQILPSHKKIEPLALNSDRGNQNTLNIKMAGSDPEIWKQGFGKMEAEWQKFYPGVPFKYHFYDEVLAEVYEEDSRMSKLANLTVFIALLISCLGLFGLSMYAILRRTKEIGVRKVLGASVAGITRLLATDFLRLVLIAVVIASPVAYHFMNKWLADFAYRIDIGWWIFAMAATLALVIAFVTVSYQSIRAALANPVKALRNE